MHWQHNNNKIQGVTSPRRWELIWNQDWWWRTRTLWRAGRTKTQTSECDVLCDLVWCRSVMWCGVWCRSVVWCGIPYSSFLSFLLFTPSSYLISSHLISSHLSIPIPLIPPSPLINTYTAHLSTVLSQTVILPLPLIFPLLHHAAIHPTIYSLLPSSTPSPPLLSHSKTYTLTHTSLLPHA